MSFNGETLGASEPASADATPGMLLKAIGLHPKKPLAPPPTGGSDAQDTVWNRKLIIGLNGLMRSFARYELFYSDIDRPWFNFNQFRVELEKRGDRKSVV